MVTYLSNTGGDAPNLKQSYVKNGHTLPVRVGGEVVSSVKSPSKPPTEPDYRKKPSWLSQPDDRKGHSPSDGVRRGALATRGTGLQEDGWRLGVMGPRSHAEGEWKSNLAWQGQIHRQMEEGRRGGRLHPEDGQRRPGLQKAPSEDGRRSRPTEGDWKPTLPRHASAEEGRAWRGEDLFQEPTTAVACFLFDLVHTFVKIAGGISGRAYPPSLLPSLCSLCTVLPDSQI